MKNRWNDDEAARYPSDLQQRVYTSRLLGQDKSLVLHGGGNTSVKIKCDNIFGETQDILYVKGSGWDLEFIEEAGFSPVKLDHLKQLATLTQLSDPQMVNELKTNMTKASAPTPSVEAILHAILPYKYVDHTHADAIVTITNTPIGQQRIENIFGDKVVIIPYVMPGFDLSRLCAELFLPNATSNTIGMVLMNHGIFSFGDTAKQSYERMIELVNLAEDYLQQHNAWQLPDSNAKASKIDINAQVHLRHAICETAKQSMIVRYHTNPTTLQFAARKDLADLIQGPATPDHVIRTKRVPMLGNTLSQYTEAYQQYFNDHASADLTMLDPAPRVILAPNFGMATVGQNTQTAQIVADIYHHTMTIIQRAVQLSGHYQALSQKDIFEVEYWDLEQAKLKTGKKTPTFSGEIAIVTGAASGIGKACVASLLQQGAAVVGLDINPAIEQLYQRADYTGICCDLTDAEAITQALQQTIMAYGGLDMLILNAGIFPHSCPIAELTQDAWRQVFAINLDTNLTLMRQCYPLLKYAYNGGRVVVIGSKNVPAPGPGAAAYSAAKAALNQLARVAALEWGDANIRINSLHPNAVFDTAIWTDEVLQSRADHYHMTIEEYKTNNVLKVEITAKDVAELATAMCSDLFAQTTGSQVPIDGGNERVI